MKPTICDVLEKNRRRHGRYATKRGDRFGAFLLPFKDASLNVLYSDGGDWEVYDFPPPAFEHASVTVASDPARCPTWGEMCYVKSLFWLPEETVIQYHPPASQYIDHHSTCLHLWRPVGFDIPLPPKSCIGYHQKVNTGESQ